MKNDPNMVFMQISSPLGSMTLGATARGLAGVWFDGQRHGPDMSRWTRSTTNLTLTEAARQLKGYFLGRLHSFDLPLDLSAGSLFQQSVWRALLSIPHGATASYGALAAQLGKTSATRAVGAAVGRNPLTIIVPCHRVIGKDGSLTGYAGGLDRKASLLRLEGVLL